MYTDHELDHEEGNHSNMTADRVREIVAAHARLAVDVATLADGADLYSAGLTSHASVNLMLALEDAFDIEFPERLLRRQTFESIAAISRAIDALALED
jgi:acyl carrier protein